MSSSEPAAANDRVIGGFLNNDPEAVRHVAEWAREVAEYNAWGFETPEDIVQTTLLALLENLRRGDFDGGNARAYVRRIAKNQCISAYRRARTHGKAIRMSLADYRNLVEPKVLEFAS